MSRLIDQLTPHAEHHNEQELPDLAELEQDPQTIRLELNTPMRRRELVPRSTAQPSTRRIRRLDGEKLAAANPLFQRWTAESPKKILDFSRNISPRKAEPRPRNRPESVIGEPVPANKRQTRQNANTTTLNSTLLSATPSDHDSFSSSLSEVDMGDVTLPASLQLANQPTEFSQRMARFRQDTCITIVEDSICLEPVDSEIEREADVTEAETGAAVKGIVTPSVILPLSPKDINVHRQADQRVPPTLAPSKTHTQESTEKENISADLSVVNQNTLFEQLVDHQLCGNEFGSGSETSDVAATVYPKPLPSPRKARGIPQGPHTPTKDDFWRQSLVDCWNDAHSPRKAVKAAMRSPMKQPSLTKASKVSFEAVKTNLAVKFVNELDTKITNGQIAQLSESTGGVKIEWSKTLSTTAGRANWKKETVRTTSPDGSDATVTYNHHASIELSEKVIDDESRLMNVLAHEFCHLANFMISGITNNPHGKDFKHWAAKCSRTFANQGVKVTTKHSYEIDFKYVWRCDGCSHSYQRHSKSINPEKHRCSGCKGRLVQIKPVPRNGGKPSEYQLFIKEEMKALKQDYPGSPQKAIMQMAASKWANRSKPTESKGKREDVGEIAAQLLGLSLRE
ncbi:hypothetical protein LLEC1_01311 [Akanthomyces lecanii]|uniref:SprT-like domain-containing protein n=1 Tax=Cordyceps confragosa TaxID=2714763 RepID=A0A179ITI8_CORDF|nr:hypothetical protein LLEC1_01311 [Akanthomyces lecanii]